MERRTRCFLVFFFFFMLYLLLLLLFTVVRVYRSLRAELVPRFVKIVDAWNATDAAQCACRRRVATSFFTCVSIVSKTWSRPPLGSTKVGCRAAYWPFAICWHYTIRRSRPRTQTTFSWRNTREKHTHTHTYRYRTILDGHKDKTENIRFLNANLFYSVRDNGATSRTVCCRSVQSRVFSKQVPLPSSATRHVYDRIGVLRKIRMDQSEVIKKLRYKLKICVWIK